MQRDERLLLAATICGSSMAFVDSTAVNVALPVLQSSLGATLAQAQWVVESYALLLSALILVGGSLGDRFGRERIYLLGVCWFAAASLWCGGATTIGQLIAARSLQGIGAALLVPGSLAIIGARIPPERRGKAIGTWSALTSLSAATGPLIGGWLVQHVSWRVVFFINIPFAIVVAAILWKYISKPVKAEGGLDIAGAALVTLTLAGAVFGLIEAPGKGWTSPAVAGALTLALAAFAALVVVERKSDHPMIPPALFRSRQFMAANGLTLFLYAALAGALFFLPFNLIQVQGFSPTAAGAALLPFVATMLFLSQPAAAMARRHGPRLLLVGGPLITACGFALLAVPSTGATYWGSFFPGILVLGVGMSLTVTPLTTVVMSSGEERHAGTMSGINNAVARTAGVMAIAVFGAVAVVIFGNGVERRLSEGKASAALHASVAAQKLKLAALQPPSGVSPSERSMVEKAVARSFVTSFRTIMVLSALLAILSSVIAAAVMRPGRPEE